VDWQWGLVLACVIAAAGYIARAAWRTWHPKPGRCGGGCGCKSPAPSGTQSFVASEQLGVLRRPRV
jgi:FeoB-associated Cys-rich membrane protein